MSLAKTAGVVVAAVIALSLAGLSEFAAAAALAGSLIAVLLLATRGSRPKGGRKARSLSFLGQYEDAAEPQSFGGLVLAGLAVWSIYEFLEPTGGKGLSLVLCVPVGCIVLFPAVTATTVGLGGAGATLGSLFLGTAACPAVLDGAGVVSYAVVLGVVGVVGRLVGVRALPIPWRPRLGGLDSGSWALIGFGLLDVAAFVVAPAGEQIWVDAPWWSRIVALLSIAVVALFGSFGPRFVLSLVAIAAALGQVFLMTTDAALSASTECGLKGLGLGYLVAFVMLASAGVALRWKA